MNCIPVCNSGDVVSVNMKAGERLKLLIPIPSKKCSIHTADGTLKRQTRSKTMCVTEVGESIRKLKVNCTVL